MAVVVVVVVLTSWVFKVRLSTRYFVDRECSIGILSKTSQIIFDLHPGFFHMEDEKGNKLHLFKKYFKMVFFFFLYKPSLVLSVYSF